ncbi:GNAT family N-acetyltransferase [Streptomyces sp. NBC_01481]|uniref:GNAT family N-acetyltransferase n=1 Tax=Streptomyces sp. NBC_01481 TaxID=2975869 RepID=UPI00224DD445|nr:GNAT family N-acetyltransferase [Streptomyces sp. NBC_01481]MCX4584172.1 GNAT family N-acetyltransferase [Streptomyces sp. NBC_01481]
MSTPLSELPIRRLTTDDLTSCADLSEDRGWPREEHKWGLLLTAGTGYGIDDPEGKGLVTACVVTSYGPGLAAIGMMLVAERYAGRGVGRRLMQHVVNEAGDIPLTLHATPYGQPLYEQLGFVETGRAEMVRGHLRVPESAPEAKVITRPATAEDLPAIVRLDAEVFGLDRTHMITRLPAFADQLRVAEEDGVLTGYAAAWPNMQTHVVGPLIARDTETAKALVASLAAGTDRPLRTDIDVRHEELIAWVKEHGLETVAFNTVMTYRIPDLPGDWTRRFAPLSVAAG